MTMNLGKLEKLLAQADDTATVVYGFTNAHSWRGIYAEVAFEPALNVTVKEMRAEVTRALTETFEGYKGGDHTYGEWTYAHLDYYGDGRDLDWGGVILSIVDALA